VCIKVLKEVAKKIEKGDKEVAIEEKIEEYCSQKDLGSYEKKVCYFIKPIKRTVSKPFTFGMSADEICHRKLKRASADICAVKYRT
jgi:mesencephalic astrocyte-derived neurotrophic factor